MMSIRDFFYGNMQPTWIARSDNDLVHGDYHYSTYMVPVEEFSVRQCCTTECEKKIKNRLNNIRGVDQVIVDYHNQKVTVMGNVRRDKLMKEIKKIKKHSRLYFRKQPGQL